MVEFAVEVGVEIEIDRQRERERERAESIMSSGGTCEGIAVWFESHSLDTFKRFSL